MTTSAPETQSSSIGKNSAWHLDLGDQDDPPIRDCRVLMASKDTSVLQGKLNPRCAPPSEAGEPPRLIAIKKFENQATCDFLHQRAILNKLNQLHNPRIAQLVASYTYRNEHILAFALSETDLYEFWMRKVPNVDINVDLEWCLREVTGLANAISMMHNMHIDQSSTGYVGLVHGDIKPSNILVTHEKLLVLNDFGLTAWSDDKSHVVTTRTYNAPEARLERKVSRANDIWSFGCVIFEFLIWLFSGGDGVGHFAQDRIMATPGSGIPLKDDHFYILKYKERRPIAAEVRETVKTYAGAMQSDRRCCETVREVLEIVTKGMIVVDPSARISANYLHEALQNVLVRHKARKPRGGSPCEA